jgi:hypothetical protein
VNHVPVTKALALGWRHRHVPRVLHSADPELRLRRSLEQPQFFVLERRCRNAPPVNASMAIRSDMHLQARDGYVHVGLVHPSLLDKPWAILYRLTVEGDDLWARRAYGKTGAQSFEDEEQYEQEWARETRRRRRRQVFREIALESFAVVSRMGDGEGKTNRTRISNVGVPASP